MQYELDVGAFDEALSHAPWLIEEAKALSRVWMLNWIANSYAMVASLPGNKERIVKFDEVIESTGHAPTSIGRASLSLAEGDYQTAIERLSSRLANEDQILETRRRLQGLSILAAAQHAAGAWDDALRSTDQALKITQECDMAPAEWRFLVQQAHANRSLNNATLADEQLEKAEALWQETAGTIPSTEHRNHYAQLAERLGI